MLLFSTITLTDTKTVKDVRSVGERRGPRRKHLRDVEGEKSADE
jgi:hypothetical protein